MNRTMPLVRKQTLVILLNVALAVAALTGLAHAAPPAGPGGDS